PRKRGRGGEEEKGSGRTRGRGWSDRRRAPRRDCDRHSIHATRRNRSKRRRRRRRRRGRRRTGLMGRTTSQLLASILVNSIYEMKNYPVVLINTVLSPL